MLINQIRTITYFCPSCGLKYFENISLFRFSGQSQIKIECSCKKSHLTIVTKDYREYNIYVSCVECGKEHHHMLNFYDMWVNSLNIIKCNQTGSEICFIGNDNEIIKHLDILEKQKDDVALKIGFENLFSNSTVMLEAINKIHDLAEQNNVECECGCTNVFISTHKDKIVLQCIKCNALNIISAKDNLDLKNILQRKQIILYNQIQYI